MKHLIELLLCSTIGAYCAWRCYAVFPLAIAEARALVAAYLERVRGIERLVDPDTD
jgi:hypothetical protein